jgi:flagellar protein FlgJ
MYMNQSLTANTMYNDFAGLANIRSQAGKDSPQALEAVAKQFEAIFLQMMLKSMRDASFGDSLFGSQQQDLYRDMFDKQLSVTLSQNNGIGLADTLVRQLKEAYPDMVSTDKVVNSKDHNPLNVKKPVELDVKEVTFTGPDDFIRSIYSHAEEVAKASGLPVEVIVAQAALETGWGKHIMTDAQGNSSFNLFGIKADSRWQGESVSVMTTEYRDGIVQRERANFRAYDSIEASISDYANFLESNPRYKDALQHADNPEAYARALQDAGYATDPAYSNKLTNIIQRYDLSSYSLKDVAEAA